jgi:asparagine synthase (glutamine-hydrolysing)
VISFFVAIWNAKDGRATATAAHIRQRIDSLLPPLATPLEQPGLMLRFRNSKSDALPALTSTGSNAVFLGTCFRNGRSNAIGRPEAASLATKSEEAKLISTSGRSAITDYWGSYVLVLRNPANQTAFVLKSPMGVIPCFQVSIRGVSLFFSSVEDLASLRILSLSIDWKYILAQASLGDYLTRETALDPIVSIQCGECIELDGERLTRHSYWSPCDVARGPAIEDFGRAASTLREATQLSVNAWAAGHKRVIHSLSGGVDSSIVAACLARAPNAPEMVCVNDFTQHPHGDERRFARSMARVTNAELVERERNPHVDLTMLLTVARTAQPVMGISSCDTYPANVRLARERGATAIFNGELGDNIFGSIAGSDSVTEYVWRHGIRPKLLSLASDYVKLTKWSLAKALYVSVRDGQFRRQPSQWSLFELTQRVATYDPLENSLISAAAFHEYRQNVDRFIHPWFKDVAGVPPGKILTIYGILAVTSTAYHGAFASPDDAETISPLVSQPLADLALSIASYVHLRGGIDRAAARSAFKDCLSEEVLRRQGKGTSIYWIKELLEHNRSFLKSFMLDGMLVKEGILDRNKLERLLSAEVDGSKVPIAHIFPQLFIEAWLHRWKDAPVSMAA